MKVQGHTLPIYMNEHVRLECILYKYFSFRRHK